jgi:hypothetical protein
MTAGVLFGLIEAGATPPGTAAWVGAESALPGAGGVRRTARPRRPPLTPGW